MPHPTSFRILQMGPYHANTGRVFSWVYILLRNATLKTVFLLFGDEWLFQKLLVKVHLDYPVIATMPLGDVHTGSLMSCGEEEKPAQQVLVKALRMPRHRDTVNDRITRNLLRECYMQSSLRHENLCRFEGLAKHGDYKLPLLVTASIPHQCMDYIRDHPEFKSTLANIMINNEGQAQLINLRAKELESIIELDFDQRTQRSTRFCAPELLKLGLTQSDVKSTFEADVFAFAMTMLQIQDGRATTLSLPYNHYRSEFQLWSTLTGNDESGIVERPLFDRYKNVSTAVQCFLQRCWEDDPERRPAMSTVISELPQVLIAF